MKSPWYAEGLRFSCTGCGKCCSGAPGAVWVNDVEIAAMAESLGLSSEAFEAQHVRQIGRRRSLHERFDGDCIFLDAATRRCGVYAARPVQCRTWPFWRDNLGSREAWNETEQDCPGAGEGALVPLERIRAQLDEHAEARRRD